MRLTGRIAGKLLPPFLLFFMLLAFSAGPSSALSVTGLKTSPEEIAPGGRFTMTASLSGDSCGAEAKFFIDGNATGSKSVGCDAESVESNELDLSKMHLDCGTHVIRVELIHAGSVVSNATIDADFGKKPQVTFTEDFSGAADLIIHFRDAGTNAPIRGLNAAVYNVRKGPDLVQTYSTDAAGDIVFHNAEQGAYVMTLDDSDYCGRFVFYVKKPLSIEGPNPQDPLVGDMVTLTVPPGVGIRVLDATGANYAFLNASFAGSANFTIEEPGNYTLVIGETSMEYWGRNISMHVSDKPGAQLRVEPAENVLRGKEVRVFASSSNESLRNVKIIIQTPEKQSQDGTTDENGSLVYVPQSTGQYLLKLSDDAYKGYVTTFSVTDSLSIDYAPHAPLTGEEISVYVRNQLKNLVEGATVSIPGVASGLTGTDGRFAFKAAKPGTYTIEASRADAREASQNMTVISPIILVVAPPETELGGNVTLDARDSAGQPVDANIEITRPDGGRVPAGGEYSPDKVGAYRVAAAKDGFIGAGANFTVTPHPLDEPLVGVMGDVIVINVTSRRMLLAGMYVSIIGPDGKQLAVTAQNGSAQAKITSDGIVRIIANEKQANPDYAESEVSYTLHKKPEAPASNLPQTVAVMAVLAIAASLVVFLFARRSAGFRDSGRKAKGSHTSGRGLSRRR